MRKRRVVLYFSDTVLRRLDIMRAVSLQDRSEFVAGLVESAWRLACDELSDILKGVTDVQDGTSSGVSGSKS